MISPIRTLGIVGGNLLASMLCLEAQKRGIQTILLEPEINNIASDLADSHMTSTIQAKSIERLALRTDAVIFCTANIPVLESKFIRTQTLYPSGDGIDLVANRVEQLVAASLCDIPTPKYYHQHNKLAFFKQLQDVTIPFRLYQVYDDGYDMIEINTPEDIEIFLMEIDEEAIEWLIEEVNTYEKTLSITALASPQKVFLYPVQEEKLEENDVKYVQIPANVTKTMEQKLGKYVRKLLKERETEGIFTFKFGMKKNRSIELININPGITVGDIATKHYTDLSVYEQFFNLLEMKLMKDGELLTPCTVTIAKEQDTSHVPSFPYHQYVLDRNNKLPISIYVKADTPKE